MPYICNLYIRACIPLGIRILFYWDVFQVLSSCCIGVLNNDTWICINMKVNILPVKK